LPKIKDMKKYTLFIITMSFGWVHLKAQQAAPAPYNSTVNKNFIRIWDAVKPESNPNNLDSNSTLVAARMTTQYVDGLGRPLQTVAKKGSMITGNGPVDLVTANVYDGFSREVNKYLPFAANGAGSNTSISDGRFKLNPFQQDSAFNKGMFSDESWYYSQTNLESSPLNRLLESFAPGNSWVGTSGQASEANRHSVKTKYWVNTSTDSVRIWRVTDVANGFGTDSTTGVYPAGTLYKNVTADEQNNQLIEFKDKGGKVILKKVQLTASPDTGAGKGHYGWLCTYYIYDNLGSLRCVIQPRGVEILAANGWTLSYSGGVLYNEQCFRYEYDMRQRMTMKKIPGAGTIWMLYDTRDRLAMSQDSLMRAGHQWLYIQYDGLNRPIATGLLSDASHYNDFLYHSSRADTSVNYPAAGAFTVDTLTQTFYDDYSWRGGQGNPLSATRNTSYDSYLQTASNSTWPYPQDATIQSGQVAGMVTGTKTKVLGTSTYLYSVNFYDDKARPVQVQSQNITTGTDITMTQYTWMGQPLLGIMKNEKAVTNAQTSIVLSQMTYDSLGRVVKIEKRASNTKVSGGSMPVSWKTIVQNEYNALGQLAKKRIGPAPLDSCSYDYNIRGFMLGMNRTFIKDTMSSANWFGYDLGYDKTGFMVSGNSKSYAAAQYSGNIGGMLWKSAGDGRLRKYDFTYDAINRLTGADFNQLTNNGFSKSAGIDFSMTGLNYDDNGNILTMNQRGWKVGGSQTIDSLLYTYVGSSNRLQNVLDRSNDTLTTMGDFRSSGLYMRTLGMSKSTSATDYSYDGNGNMYADNNKDISNIHYNYLNLPDSIAVTNKGYIKYVYDAAGNKIKKITTEGSKVTTTMYLFGNYVNDTLQFLPQEEGRIRFRGADGSFQYDYFLKDHLGNVRMVLTEQKDTAKYLASMESAYRSTENALFYNIPATSYSRTSATGYPIDHVTTNPNDSVIRVNGSGQKVGPAIILKVMSGDKVDIGVNYYYNGSGATNGQSVSVSDIINSLANGIVSVAGPSHGSVAFLSGGSSPLQGALTSYLSANNPTTSGKPNAYLNWILVDNQFNYVSSYPQSGALQVGTAGTTGGGTLQTPLGYTGIPITKSGYLYIYVSNATPNWDVFFDNLSVKTYSGPMLEENHYYPFGLVMQGISDRALKTSYAENKYRFNKGSELQNKEFSDGSGLEMYATHLRELDPQLGRWWQIDSKPDYAQSPYCSMGNNPILHNDPLGDSLPNPQAAQKVNDKLNQAVNEFKQVFSGSASASAKVWGVGAGIKAGPVDLKGEVNLGKVKGSVGSNGELKLTGTALNAKGEAGFGGNKVSASGDVLKGSVTLGSNGVKAEGTVATGSAQGTRGNFTFDNSAVLGGSFKIGPVEVEGSVNLGHAAMGAVHLVEAATEYIKGVAEDYFQHAPWSFSK
jgi:RHS repeat-associated protein